MQLLAAVVLAASVGNTSGTLQHEQVRAAGALWRITLSVREIGYFRTADGSEVSSVLSDDQGFGSGVMVSPDGYLLTAFHVVGPSEIARDACTIDLKKYQKPILRSLRVDYVLRDIVENQVIGRITILPKAKGGNICTDPAAVTWKHDEVFPFRIVKLEPAMDLALLKLEVTDAAFVPTSDRTPSEHEALYALGFIEADQFTKKTGLFIRECELVTDIEQGDGSMDATKYQFMRILVAVKEGMSGGPVLAGSSLAGITVVHSDFESEERKDDGTTEKVTTEGGYAVPGRYVHAWYLWATGQSTVKPAGVCEHPYIEPDTETPKSSKPRR